MTTGRANLDVTQYVKVADAGSSVLLQSHRDTVRIVFSELKPAKGNTAFHELGGEHNPLNIPYTDTSIWALAMTERSALTITFQPLPLAPVELFDSNGLNLDLTDNSNVPVEIKHSNGDAVDTQHPIPCNGDSVYAKDIWPSESNMFNFSGVVTDLVDNLHSSITDITVNNPKELLVHFERTVVSDAIGLGAFTGGFSNTEIQIGNSGGVFTTVVDESGDSTLKTTETYQLPVVAGFNAIKLIFHTPNTITLSNLFILKISGVVSRLQAVSEVSGLVEDVKSFNNALNVTDGLVHKVFINRFFSQVTATTTTLAVAATSQDITINVVSPVGFSVGDEIFIGTGQAVVASELKFIITNIVANALTVNRPLDLAHSIGEPVVVVTQNMAVDGSITPQSFRVTPPTSGGESIFQVTRFLISMSHSGVPDDGKFGGIAALLNGVLIRAFKNGAWVTATQWQNNGDLITDMFDVNYSDKAPAGANGTNGRWTITETGAVFEMDGTNSDFLEVLIQDDLRDLNRFVIKAQGRVFGL